MATLIGSGKSRVKTWIDGAASGKAFMLTKKYYIAAGNSPSSGPLISFGRVNSKQARSDNQSKSASGKGGSG